MEGKQSLKDMNMGQLWALARSRKIDYKGMKKVDLIKALSAEAKEVAAKPVEKKTESKKATKIDMVEATLEDGTKVLIPANTVKPTTESVTDEDGLVTITSVDGRELEVSIGGTVWVGKEIKVPAEQEEDVKRLLKEGHYYFI